MAGFQDLYSEYGRPLYRYLLSLTRDEHMAEEIMQETFYQVFLHIDDFQGNSSIYTWICQIGKNAWLKECRRQKHYDDAAMEDDLLSATTDIEEEIIKKMQAQDGSYILAHLTEPYHMVFIKHVYEEKSLAEIAQEYGKSESWARVTYYRAKHMIMERMEEKSL